VSTDHNLSEEKGEPKRNRTYQPNGLPLGRTGSDRQTDRQTDRQSNNNKPQGPPEVVKKEEKEKRKEKKKV